MFKPLEGIKVIDLCLAGAGPSCTIILTEYGADDIWIEPLTGASTRDVFKYDFYTTGKRAITLDLKTPEGKEVIYRLIKDEDVFVSNYRPAAIERLGLDYETLKELNPKLIYATISGFGEEGSINSQKTGV
ncbi:CoA transferase [Eubacteriaceae bacterium ES3]|nr:CoA transferase [Eubacteriaceae bacterium ES3]